MFALASIAVGLAVALAIGGKPSRLLELRFRAPWLVLVALAAQVVLFSRLGHGVSPEAAATIHSGSYGLLLVFALLNREVRALRLLVAGLVLNAIAIGANGGAMPLAPEAARTAGVTSGANVDADAERLTFLGDVFALPSVLPFANAFSVGDVLIALGMILLIVHGSLRSPFEPLLRIGNLRTPLESRDFRALVSGRVVSVTGDWLTAAAVIAWIYGASGGETLWVALVLLARIAPPILAGGVAATVADRISKRTLLVGVELARCAVVLGTIASIVAGSRIAVVACMALSGGLAALTAAVVPALVPALVPEHRYEAANSLVGVIENCAMAAGALCGGLALRAVGAPLALTLDLVTFVVAAVLFARMRAAVGEATEDDDPVDRSTVSAFRYVLANRRLAAAVGCFAAAIVATGLANATLPRLLRDDLAVGPGAYGFGLAAIGIGLAAGQLAAGSASVGESGMRWLGTALALMAGTFALLALVDHAPTAFLLLGLIGLIDGTTDSVFDTVVQREADSRRHGAVFGIAASVFSTAMLLSVAAAPLLNAVAPASAAIGGGAVALVVASMIGFAGAREPGGLRPRLLRAPRAA